MTDGSRHQGAELEGEVAATALAVVDVIQGVQFVGVESDPGTEIA